MNKNLHLIPKRGEVKALDILTVLFIDFYKSGHIRQYPDDLEWVYSNFTPRRSLRNDDTIGIVWFGLQAFIMDFLMREFDEHFFNKSREEVARLYQRRMNNALGPGMNIDHILALHGLGYLPILIKALPEGTIVPYGVPALTIQSTHDNFGWVTNSLETILSSEIWHPCTSATTAHGYRVTFDEYAKLTGSSLDFVPWQLHDFSFRGMPGRYAAMASGAGHLLSSTGTDTCPSIDWLEHFYAANSDKEMVGGSVAATEHAVTSVGIATIGELAFIKRLITEKYPTGCISLVSDTMDLWEVLTVYWPALKDEIMARDGKVVARPDSGEPENILCGDPNAPEGSPKWFGVIRLLWNTFGGTITSTGHKLLDSHVGAIYGESITRKRQRNILQRLHEMGFASGNVVFGIGSFSYQYVTRDTDGSAIKATACKTKSNGFVEIFKDPVTDREDGKPGFKKSARGLLRVDSDNGVPVFRQRVSFEEEAGGYLEPVFKNSEMLRFQTLGDIRGILANGGKLALDLTDK